MKRLQYPIGHYDYSSAFVEDTIKKKIDVIDAFPGKLRTLAEKATSGQIDMTYRPDGWTVRQVINHCADSHLNAYARFKRVTTENIPTINPYDQNKWAETEDGKHGDIQVSLQLIESLHNRWVRYMRSLPESAFDLEYNHPEHSGTQKLMYLLGLYAWHCQHHLEHIKLVVK